MKAKEIFTIAGCLFGIALTGECLAYEDTTEQEFDFAGKTSLRLDLEDADVSYIGENRKSVVVAIERSVTEVTDAEAEKVKEVPALVFAESSDGLHIKENSEIKIPGAKIAQTITIRGPKNVEFQAKLDEGDLSLQAIQGEVSAKVENGDLSIRAIEGHVSIKIDDGDLSLHNIDGGLSAKLEDGDLEVVGLSGPLELKMEDGNASIKNLGNSFNIKMEDGDLDMSLSAAPENDSNIQIEDGSLGLHLPQSVSANLTVEMEDGRLDLGKSGDAVLLSSNKKTQTFALNGGGPQIRVSIEDGNLYLK